MNGASAAQSFAEAIHILPPNRSLSRSGSRFAWAGSDIKAKVVDPLPDIRVTSAPFSLKNF